LKTSADMNIIQIYMNRKKIFIYSEQFYNMMNFQIMYIFLRIDSVFCISAILGGNGYER